MTRYCMRWPCQEIRVVFQVSDDMTGHYVGQLHPVECQSTYPRFIDQFDVARSPHVGYARCGWVQQRGWHADLSGFWLVLMVRFYLLWLVDWAFDLRILTWMPSGIHVDLSYNSCGLFKGLTSLCLQNLSPTLICFKNFHLDAFLTIFCQSNFEKIKDIMTERAIT